MQQQTSAPPWRDHGAREKPVGGYRLIPVSDLCAAWVAYSEGQITLAAFRTWAACQELRKRREFITAGRTPRYRLDELLRLTGDTEARARKSLRALKRAGLITSSATELEFHTPPDLQDGVGEMVEILEVERRGRLVPFPREVLKLLAAHTTKARLACLIAHSLRVLHGGGRTNVRCSGRAKASAIAEAFGISERSVHRERRALREMGLLNHLQEPDKQWAINTHGARFVWNLEWRRPGQNDPSGKPEAAPVENSPVGEETSTCLSVAEPSAGTCLSGLKTRTSSSSKMISTQTTHAGGDGSSTKKQGRGSSKHLTVADLRDDERLQRLFEREVALGNFSAGEASRLSYWSAAEHALTVGTTNPCGLFVETLKSFKLRDDPPPGLPRKRRLWQFLTLADEDSARARLQRFDGRSRPARQGGGVEREQLGNNQESAYPRDELSPDALLVGRLRRRFAGLSDAEILSQLQRQCSAWTDRRWLDARTELATQHLRRPTREDGTPSSAATVLQGLMGSGNLRGGQSAVG